MEFSSIETPRQLVAPEVQYGVRIYAIGVIQSLLQLRLHLPAGDGRVDALLELVEELGDVKRLDSVANIFVVMYLTQVSTINSILDLFILTDLYFRRIGPLSLPYGVFKALM